MRMSITELVNGEPPNKPDRNRFIGGSDARNEPGRGGADTALEGKARRSRTEGPQR